MLLAMLLSIPLTKVEIDFRITTGRDTWTVRGHADYFEPFEGRLVVRRNETVVHAYSDDGSCPEPPWLPWGIYFQAARPRVRAPFPVFVIAGHSGIGEHEDRMFYGIVNRRLVILGKPPANNSNGPVNWRGRKDMWVFDDYDWYLQRDTHQPIKHHLYRVTTSGMEFVRSWQAPGNVRVKDTVGLFF